MNLYIKTTRNKTKLKTGKQANKQKPCFIITSPRSIIKRDEKSVGKMLATKTWRPSLFSSISLTSGYGCRADTGKASAGEAET